MIHLRDKLAALQDVRERTDDPQKRARVTNKMLWVLKRIREEREQCNRE